MPRPNELHPRLALIPLLAERSKGGYMGRTALMKYMYLLQSVRNVPLDYHFTLYSYGPFDSSVLTDLSVAESLEAVKSELELYSGGYGYKIRSDHNSDWLQTRASRFLKRHEKDVTWVIRNFGSFSSAELELAGTIVYVDREGTSSKRRAGLDQIARLVHEVKPHFSKERILQMAQNLANEGILESAA